MVKLNLLKAKNFMDSDGKKYVSKDSTDTLNVYEVGDDDAVRLLALCNHNDIPYFGLVEGEKLPETAKSVEDESPEKSGEELDTGLGNEAEVNVAAEPEKEPLVKKTVAKKTIKVGGKNKPAGTEKSIQV